MSDFTDEQIVTLQAQQLLAVRHERDGYKAELGRIAAAVYPHKEAPFTYSVDFVIDEIERARVREAELQALISANSEELKSARTAIYRHTELAARVKTLEGVIDAADRINNEVCERVGIPPFGCDTADHLVDEIEGLRQRAKTLEDALKHVLEVTEPPDRETYLSDFIKQALAAKEPFVAPSDICSCPYPDFWQGRQHCGHCGKPSAASLEAIRAEAKAEEREACAKIIAGLAETACNALVLVRMVLLDSTKAIRARGDAGEAAK